MSGAAGVRRARVFCISLWAREMSRGESQCLSWSLRMAGTAAREKAPQPVLTSLVSSLRGRVSQQPSPGPQLQPAGHQQQGLWPPGQPLPRASPAGARLPPLGGTGREGQFQLYHHPSKKHPGLIFRMDWLDLLAVKVTLKSLLQHHSSKTSILWRSAFFTVQLSHPYMTTGKTIALTRQTFVDKVMSTF